MAFPRDWKALSTALFILSTESGSVVPLRLVMMKLSVHMGYVIFEGLWVSVVVMVAVLAGGASSAAVMALVFKCFLAFRVKHNSDISL